jgi:general secretion pathway protein D
MSLRFLRLFLTAAFLAVTVVVVAQAQTPPAATAPANDPLVGPIKMPDADIDTVFGALESLTGKTIFRPQALPTATYNIRIDKDTPTSRAILYIMTALQLNGIGIMPLDEHTLKAVASTSARTEAPELITGSALAMPPSGKIATKIFMLNFLRSTELQAQIGNMLTPNLGGPQSMVQLPNQNAVLITETVTNLQRIETLLNTVDRPATANMIPKFYALKNGAKASDLVARINTIIAPQRAQLGTATTLTADDRSNQIILISHPANYPLFDSLVGALDVKADPNTNNDVIYLKHAKSTDVAALLNNLVNGQNTIAQRTAANSVRPGQGVAGVNGQNPNVVGPGGVNITPNNVTFQGQAPGNNIPGGGPNGAGGGAQVPVLNTPQPLVFPNQPVLGNNLLNALGEGVGSQFSSMITIAADERSNAIVVTGTATDLGMIRHLIEKLDVLLAQVRIEVIVAEVTLGDTDKSGISALNLTVGTDTPLGPGGDNGRGTHITNFGTTVSGWAITSGVVNPLAFDAAFSDAGNRNNVKVLQAATIATAHNKPGEVVVGSSVPYTTTTTTNGVSNQSVNFKDINLDLKVTPLIGDDGSIQLDIDQLIQDQTGSITVEGSAVPIIGTRHATSFINVYDGQMIVLGGLQRTALTNSRQKIGLIYEIPIISNLFGARTKTTDRTELLLFIRPHVMPPEKAQADAEKSIETLSNKEQVKEYLKNPGKMPKEGILEQFK